MNIEKKKKKKFTPKEKRRRCATMTLPNSAWGLTHSRRAHVRRMAAPSERWESQVHTSTPFCSPQLNQVSVPSPIPTPYTPQALREPICTRTSFDSFHSRGCTWLAKWTAWIGVHFEVHLHVNGFWSGQVFLMCVHRKHHMRFRARLGLGFRYLSCWGSTSWGEKGVWTKAVITLTEC